MPTGEHEPHTLVLGLPAASLLTVPVCRRCACALTPFRIVVDVGRLDRWSGDEDATVAHTSRLVDRVRASRGHGQGPLVLRAADVHRLARGLGTTRTHLALRLADRDLLVDVDSGAAPMSGRRPLVRP
jgi:hypothetical protein